MKLREDDYYTHKLKYSWRDKLRKILSIEYVKYRKENCHEFKLGFTRFGRESIQECRLKAKIVAAEKGMEYLKTLVPKDQMDEQQILGTIQLLQKQINDFQNITIYR